MLVALSEGETPDRAPDDYVGDFFDWYADHFDQNLTDELHCSGPQQVA